jgi:hypothetical protein
MKWIAEDEVISTSKEDLLEPVLNLKAHNPAKVRLIISYDPALVRQSGSGNQNVSVGNQFSALYRSA